MSVNAHKLRLRAAVLHRLSNFAEGTASANVIGLMRNTAKMLHAASQKLDHVEREVAKQQAATRAELFRAWEEGHGHCFHVENPNNRERNPYKPEKS